MPIYDYRCDGCGRRFARFFRSFADVAPASCPRCGASGTRLPSRVRLLRSEESRLDDLADPSSLGDVDESDPSSVARWTKRVGEAMGEDLSEDVEQAMSEGGPEDAAAEDEPLD